MNVVVSNQVIKRISDYCSYLIDSGITSEERAHEKIDYIKIMIHNSLSKDYIEGIRCPYWNFSGAGRGYRMIQIKDKWTKTTKWDVAYETRYNEPLRIVRGIELESVLASTDEKRYPPYQMKLPLDEHRMTQIIRQVIREMLYA